MLILFFILLIVSISLFFLIKITNDKVDKYSIVLNIGENYLLEIKEENKTFESSNKEIANVDEFGNITAISIGNAKITVKIDNKVKYKYSINVLEDNSTSIIFDEKTIELTQGNSHQIKYTLSNPSIDIIWKSSDNNIVTVDKFGNIVAKSPGTSTITATTPNGLQETCTIIVTSNNTNNNISNNTQNNINKEPVKEEIKSIKFTDSNKQLYIGQNYQTSIKFEPSYLSSKISYKSSNEKVVSVSKNGLVKAISVGSATITATTTNNISTTLNITVLKQQTETKNKYTATFDANGASISYKSKNCTTSGTNCSVKSPKITRDGYKIIGWSTNKDSKTAEYESSDSIKLYSDTTYYAITSKKVTINFESNGSSLSKTSVSCNIYNKMDSCNIITPTITRSGYNILGFNTDSKATTSNINHGKSLKVSSNKTYYAITSKTLSATFNGNGATVSKNNVTCNIYNKEKSCNITTPTITRNGFNILGFDTNVNSLTASITQNKTLTLTLDVIYYAITNKKVKVMFNANRATLSASTASCEIKNAATSCNITTPTISRKNYTVLGYGPSANSSSANIGSGKTISVSSDITYYAITKINTDGIIEGCTGWSAINTKHYSSASTSSSSSTLKVGTAFTIEGISGNFFKVTIPGVAGYRYVEHAYVMVNLSDYIPSIIYQISNASFSIYKSSGYSLPNVTGTKLYSAGKIYNIRLRRNEYIAPLLYSTAQKVLKVQNNLKNQGYLLKIYDSYRPHSVSVKIYNSLTSLYNSNSTVKQNIDYSTGLSGKQYTWGKTWFLAPGVSKHNTGSAIDVTIVSSSTKNEFSMSTSMHELSTKAIKYYSPNVAKTASNYSKEMNTYSKLLDSVMTSYGMDTLASEWWHFQETSAHNRILKYMTNGCDFQPTTLYSY